MKIERGKYGDLSLDGTGLAFAAKWPGAIHEGNGTVCLFVDEKLLLRNERRCWKSVRARRVVCGCSWATGPTSDDAGPVAVGTCNRF